jgi:hypothetical protein
MQRMGLNSAYSTYARGDQDGAATWLGENGGMAPQEAKALLEAYHQLKQSGQA